MTDRKKPYVIEEEAGTKAYCACGRSGNKPHCDGSHQGSGVGPHVVIIDKKKTVAICGCGKSENMPYCDGTHTGLS